MAGVLAFLAAVLGVWAGGFPLSFYNDFPIAGWHWVSLLGPYNEHLVRDFGATMLALLVFTVWAWRTPTVEKLRVTGWAWLVFSVVHFLWHMLHLGVFTTAHKVGNVIALALILGLAVLLVVPDRKDDIKGHS
ncbi:hypothetical protein [Paractinoplanes atraurantiacus]|uniref:Uncharacterized protein n=1 Tax=Paractinoplanes atraurantiacus TaxID=1036182 RepID=A0A285IC31_9ACTN|nr:hypothetical protein [Actinoplanes atraurantiacus]SNY45535.1 hypothetical protein SAMN05421748_107246 [Actinoplanes atraurantiacus]